VFAVFGGSYLWHRKHGIQFPPLDSVKLLFHEGAASGCSHRSILTRFGGASRCLKVTVTDREVWIRLSFPLSILPPIYDLEHRISRDSICSVEESASGWFPSVLLDYRTDAGAVRRIQLRLRNPDGFIAVLKGPPPLP
jgi:hypothetical protein